MKKTIAGSLIMLILFMFNSNIIFAGENRDTLITGFNTDSQILASYTVSRNTAEEELLSCFPKELEVFIDGNSEITMLPVSWSAYGETVADTKYYYLQYSPDFGSEYSFSDEIDPLKDLPYVAVYINDEALTGPETFSAPEGSVVTCDNAVTTYRYLRNNMGFNCASACGVMANIQCESGFNPKAVGDGGTSFGICQWHGARWTKCVEFCHENKLDEFSMEGQLRYLDYELQSDAYFSSILKYMLEKISNDPDGAYEAGRYWCVKFEIPANKEQKGAERGNLSKNTYYPEYSSGFYDDDPVEEIVPVSLIQGQKFDVKSIINDGIYDSYKVKPKKYATVSKAGILKAKKATNGTEVLISGIITREGRKKESGKKISLTVYKPEIIEKKVSLVAGETFSISANVSIQPDKWEISNSSVAVMDVNTGILTAKSKGKTKVTAIYGTDPATAAKYTIEINCGEPVFNKKSLSVKSGKVMELSLSYKGRKLDAYWSSDNGNIAGVVSENGIMTAVSAGSTVIKAKYLDKEYSLNVSVKMPKLSFNKAKIKVGNTKTIKLKNTLITDVVWESSDEKVAVVDKYGVITAVAPGTAVISTKTGGCTGTCTVTVP